MDSIIEITALITGLIVIAIETVIIFLLKKHVGELDVHLEKTENLVCQFEKKMEKHLSHLDAHSHKIDRKLETLFKTICPRQERRGK